MPSDRLSAQLASCPPSDPPSPRVGADEVYRPVCYALFENERGESVIEPVVSFYDDDGPTGTTSARFCLASEVPGRDVWTMSQHGARFEYALVGADEDAINITEERSRPPS